MGTRGEGRGRSTWSASTTGSGRHLAGQPLAIALSVFDISLICDSFARISASDVGHLSVQRGAGVQGM